MRDMSGLESRDTQERRYEKSGRLPEGMRTQPEKGSDHAQLPDKTSDLKKS